jgi:hypothetical protein
MLAKRMTKHYITFVSLVLVFLVILSTEARADLYGFEAISDNSGVSGLMAAQLSLEVTVYGSDQVLFAFKNNIAPYSVGTPEEGIIGSVFFEDGALLQLAIVLDTDNFPTTYPGVDFETSENPESKTFPAGGTLDPPFQTTAHFWATTDGQLNTNGVNPGEQVGIVFDLEEGATFADVITAISLGFTNPDPGGDISLRIGVHVQNLGPNGDSDALISTPIPASVVLGMLGLGVVGWKLRKFA